VNYLVSCLTHPIAIFVLRVRSPVAQVIFENVYKSYQPSVNQESDVNPESRGETRGGAVLRSINLRIHDGEFMVLVGPSGCGKSTLLRMIAGLESVTGGTISVGDRVVNALPPKDRDIAMVFQSYALYPHLTVYDNLAFGLRRATVERSDGAMPQGLETWLVETSRMLPRRMRYVTSREQTIDRKIHQVAQALQIEELLNRLPKQLSGGQKQRVALGRAMARDPQVFLMDEPLSNLDAKLRAETRSEIVKLQRKLGTTTIYVTHDQTEAMTMGDRIAVLNNGQIQQLATPLELYNQPVNRFVAQFIGSPPMNFIPVQVRSPLLIQSAGEFRMTLSHRWERVLAEYDGQAIDLGIRPEHLGYGVPAPKNLPITVELTEALGSETYVYGRFEGTPIVAKIDSDRLVRVGDQIWLTINPEKLQLFDPGTGLAVRPI
jgi:multiple sugar transport system ATP-binding protein